MASYTKVTRSSLFEVDQNQDQNDYIPDIELDIVEMEESDKPEEFDKEPEEFDFPLFSFMPTQDKEEVDEQKRGRSESIMKVSLREVSEERIINERDSSYYFSQYNDEQKRQFIEMAISGEEVLIHSQEHNFDSHPWKVLDLTKFNHEIQIQLDHNKKRFKQRPGKNKRIGKIKSRERKQAREKRNKEIQKEQQRLLKKKMFHKRGGKKHKKKTESGPTSSQPIYRTE